ncbi:helical backbone metal receptor [Deinococcus yavapaiensis]|nr:helical backbone metal receptor [Deinococcus yavapaiensis]
MTASRIASLTCSNTEILMALGLADRIVAADSHSDAPEVANVPRLGPDLDIDIDELVAARPDLVLSSLSVPGMERVVAAVDQAGLPQLVLDATSWSGVLRDIRVVGEALGVTARAEAVVAELRAEAASARRVFARPPSVVVEWWPKPLIVATRDSWITDMLTLLGARNAFEHVDARSAVVTLEDVRDAKPDLLVLSWCGAKKLRPDVAEKRGLGMRVACIPESALGRPGPRLVEGFRALSSLLSEVEDGANAR